MADPLFKAAPPGLPARLRRCFRPLPLSKERLRGFSVVELAAASAIMGIIILGNLSLVQNMTLSSNSVRAKESRSKFERFVLSVTDGAACASTFSGKAIGQPISQIKSDLKFCYSDTGVRAGCSAGFEASCDTLQNPLKACSAASECGGSGTHCQSLDSVFWDISQRGGLYGDNFKIVKAQTAPKPKPDPADPGRILPGSHTSGLALLKFYYSQPGTRFEVKREGQPCSASNQRGCYELDLHVFLEGGKGKPGDSVGFCRLASAITKTKKAKGCLLIDCAAWAGGSHPIGKLYPDISFGEGEDCFVNNVFQKRVYINTDRAYNRQSGGPARGCGHVVCAGVSLSHGGPPPASVCPNGIKACVSYRHRYTECKGIFDYDSRVGLDRHLIRERHLKWHDPHKTEWAQNYRCTGSAKEGERTCSYYWVCQRPEDRGKRYFFQARPSGYICKP